MKRIIAALLTITFVFLPVFSVLAKDECFNSETVTVYGAGNVKFAKHEIIYDEKGRVVRMTQYKTKGDEFVPETKAEVSYDKYGNMSHEEYYSANAKGEWVYLAKIEVTYRSDGNVTREYTAAYDEKGKISSEYENLYEYDSFGNETHVTQKSKDDLGTTESEIKHEYEYDGKNRVTKKTSSVIDGGKWTVSEIETRDYTDGVLIRVYSVEGGVQIPFGEEKHVYDADGNETYYEYKESDGKGGLVNSAKSVVTFENGETTHAEEYVWDGADWSLSSKYDAVFDDKMNISSYVEEYEIGTPDHSGSKAVYTFDSENRVTLIIESSLYDEKWSETQKTEYVYDETTGGIVRNEYLKNGEKWELSMKYVTEYDGHHTHIVDNGDGTYECADCGAKLYDGTGKLLSPNTGDNTVVYVIIAAAVVVVAIVVLKLLKKKKDE